MKYLNGNKKNSLNNLEKFLNARRLKQQNQSKIVKKLLLDVKKYGDKSVLKFEKKFSKLKTNTKKIKFSKDEINQISKKVDKKLKKSIDIAFKRIKYFHTKQKFSSFKYKDKFPVELKKYWFDIFALDEEFVQIGHGSGNYFKMGKHRFIITAAHVVDGGEVWIQDGLEVVKSETLWVDKERDIAIIRPMGELSMTKPVKLKVQHRGYKKTPSNSHELWNLWVQV